MFGVRACGFGIIRVMKKLISIAMVAALSAVCGCAAAKAPRVSILGDSYSTYEGAIPEGNACWYFAAPKNRNDVTEKEQCWWYQAVGLLGGTLERNEAFSGSTVCNTGYGGKDVTTTSFIARADRLGEPDVILVCGATNDSWANVPIGEFKYADFTAADLKTFRPGMAKMCEKLRATYPKAKVYFILNDCLKPVINDSVHEICRHYGIPCVDLKDISKGKGHPDIAGMKAFAEQVAAFVKAN